MKNWLLRFITFLLTLFLGAVVIGWLNHFANSSWRSVLYDLNLLGSCPRDPHLLISCTLSPIVNYLLIAIALVVSIVNSLILARKNKVYYTPIILMLIIAGFIISKVVVDNLTSSLGPSPVEVPIK